MLGETLEITVDDGRSSGATSVVAPGSQPTTINARLIDTSQVVLYGNIRLTTPWLHELMEFAYLGERLTGSQCGRMDQACIYGKTPVLLTFQRSVDIRVEPVLPELEVEDGRRQRNFEINTFRLYYRHRYSIKFIMI